MTASFLGLHPTIHLLLFHDVT